MSGHFDALLLGLGALSVALVVWLSVRMRLVDREGVPLHTLQRAVPYGLWLFKEIVTSNLAVGRRVLSPGLKIEPQVFEVEGGQADDVGRMLYANSITLTPGTVTIDVDDDRMIVHGLTDEAAQDLKSGVMQAKVAWEVGGEG